MKKNIIIMVCAISLFIGFSACKSKQHVEKAEAAAMAETVGESVKIDPLLVGKHWKLVELNGKPVEKTEAFLLLDQNKSTVSGNLGCNTFNGAYELKNGNRIKFSQLTNTLKMCINDMEIEEGFKKALGIADNYYVSEKNLVLNRARMAPLARFELVK
jgi:heat shock protein HslJ